jgi:hypothetical protein
MIAFWSSALTFNCIYADSRIQTAMEQFVSCIHLVVLRFLLLCIVISYVTFVPCFDFIIIVCDALTEVFPAFFISYKANARVQLIKDGTRSALIDYMYIIQYSMSYFFNLCYYCVQIT